MYRLSRNCIFLFFVYYIEVFYYCIWDDSSTLWKISKFLYYHNGLMFLKCLPQINQICYIKLHVSPIFTYIYMFSYMYLMNQFFCIFTDDSENKQTIKIKSLRGEVALWFNSKNNIYTHIMYKRVAL